MTLIAATTNKIYPIIIGDLMISSPVENSVNIPSHSIDINPYLENIGDRKPSGFFQKIYVINPNVVVALAGSVVIMKSFLQELKIRCGYYLELNTGIVEAIIKDMELGQQWENFAFLLLWMEHSEDGTIYPYQITGPSKHWQHGFSSILDEVMACGSGAQSFINRVSDNVHAEFSDEGPSAVRATMQNMIYLGTLLASERTTLFNVLELWGAGFEIIRYTENGFAKFDNHAFVLVEGQFDADGKLSRLVPKMVQHYRYIQDILLIAAIELTDPQTIEKDKITITESNKILESFYFVPSLDTLEDFDFSKYSDNLSFTTNTLVIGYSIIYNEMSATYPGIFIEDTDVTVCYEKGKKIILKLPADIEQKVFVGVIENYNLHKSK